MNNEYNFIKQNISNINSSNIKNIYGVPWLYNIYSDFFESNIILFHKRDFVIKITYY